MDGWTVFPSIFVGGVYNTNVNQSATGTDRSSDFGLRVAPHMAGTYDGGIHKTSFYGAVDARVFQRQYGRCQCGLFARLPSDAGSHI